MSDFFSPYISFPNNAKEVLEHYRDLFGGQLDLLTYGSMPPMEGMPFTPPAEAVAHAQLHGGLVTLAGGDSISGNAGDALNLGSASFLLTLDDLDDARALIQKIVDAGGEIAMPFEQAPWGDYYGQAKDRYGVTWQFNTPVGESKY